MKRFYAIMVAGALVGKAANAQSTFTLKEAIQHSLQNHGSTVIYKNDLEKVRQQSREALSAYLPQVAANVNFDDNLRLQSTIIPGGAFGGTEERKVQFGNKYNTNAVLQLDQTIYDQALLLGIKAGVPTKKIAELNQAKNNEELIYNTASAYSNILILKEQQKLLAQNEKRYSELYNITKFRFEKGVAKKVELDRAQVQLNNVRAQQRQIATDIELAYNSLKNAMGLPLNSALQVEDSIDYQSFQAIPAGPVDVRSRIEYQLQEQSIVLQEIDVKRKQAASLPTVSAYARYGGQAFGNSIGAATSNWGSYSAIGVRVSIPILSGNRRNAQTQQSRLELANMKQNLDLSAGQLELQFQNAGRQLQENVTMLATNRSNMDLAKSVYHTSQFEYSKGVSSMADLLNADFSYQQSQANYMTSLLNLVNNRLAYERAKGTLTGFINQL